MGKHKVQQFIIRYGHQILVGWWFLTRPNTQGVKCVIELKNSGRFLLVRLSYAHRKWSVPGGGIQKEESAREAAVREIDEELGIHITPSQLREIGQYHQVIEFKSDTVTCFYVSVLTEDFRIDNKEVAEAGWFSVDNLPQTRTPSVDKIIAMHRNSYE